MLMFLILCSFHMVHSRSYVKNMVPVVFPGIHNIPLYSKFSALTTIDIRNRDIWSEIYFVYTFFPKTSSLYFTTSITKKIYQVWQWQISVSCWNSVYPHRDPLTSSRCPASHHPQVAVVRESALFLASLNGATTQPIVKSVIQAQYLELFLAYINLISHIHTAISTSRTNINIRYTPDLLCGKRIYFYFFLPRKSVSHAMCTNWGLGINQSVNGEQLLHPKDRHLPHLRGVPYWYI